MRGLRIFLFILFPLGLSGQIWLDSDGFKPEVDQQFILHTFSPESNFLDTDSELWDARSIVIKRSQAVRIIAPSESLYEKEFQESSLCYNLGGGNLLYAGCTEYGYYKYGGKAGETILAFSDPELYFPFPMEKGKQWSDDFQSLFKIGAIEFKRNGQIIGQAISTGTLIMPYGVMTGVIKVKITESLRDSYEVMGNPVVSVTRNETICFLLKGNMEPLLAITNSYVQGELVNTFGTFLEGSQVKMEKGPWRDLQVKEKAEGQRSLEFISEWDGLLELDLLDEKGKLILSIEESKVKPGPESISIPRESGARYLRLRIEGQETLIPLD